MDLLNQHLGKVLLAVALIVAVGLNVINVAPPIPWEHSTQGLQVMVPLDRSKMAVRSSEPFFLQEVNKGSWEAPVDRFVFVEEVKTQPFQAVALELPPTTIQRPAQLVPDPGPSLEGTAKLPRYGDEFGLAPVPGSGSGSGATPGSGTGGTPSGATSGAAPAGSGAGSPAVPVSPYKNPFVAEPPPPARTDAPGRSK